MHYFYSSEKEPFTGKSLPLSMVDKNEMFNRHLAILYELRFIASNPLATYSERYQANKEIEIAEKKMKYWSRFKDFDQKLMIQENERLRKMWSSKETDSKRST